MELFGKLVGLPVTKEELVVLEEARSSFKKEKGVLMTNIQEDIEKLGNVTDNWTVLREILKQIVEITHPKKKGK